LENIVKELNDDEHIGRSLGKIGDLVIEEEWKGIFPGNTSAVNQSN
jgi:hypothetical protein